MRAAPGEATSVQLGCTDAQGVTHAPVPGDLTEPLPNFDGQDQFNFSVVPQAAPLDCVVHVAFGNRNAPDADGRARFRVPAR